MVIRPMKIEDISVVEEIEKEIFSTPWSTEAFIYELTKNPFSQMLVLEKEAVIIGYISFWLLGDQTQIATLGITKKEQGKGYAKELMEACIQATKEKEYPRISLEVRVSNIAAIRLYTSFGFQIVSRRKQYYTDTGEDAYMMLKEMEV